MDFLEPRTGLEPVTLLALPTELTRHICGNTTTHYDSGPLCAAFLTSGRIKHLEFIYPKIHTKLPLCLERLVSCILINYIRQVLPPKETVSTLSRSANISWLFIQLHLTNCCFARNIWDHLLLQPEMGGLIWHINLGFVAPRFVPAGNRFFPYHLSYQLCTTGFIKVHLFRDFHPRLMETYYV